MEIINSLKNINNQLASLIENDEYTSIGYVPILNSITPADIITIKKAQKLLDVVVVQNVSEDYLNEFSKKALNQLTPNLIIDKLDENFSEVHISFEAPNINNINLMRGILAVLPSSVFINQDNFEIFKTINIIEDTFKELFSLQDVSNPESIKSFKELEIIKELQSLEKSNLKISKSSILEYLNQYNIADYQEFNHNNQLFINLKIADQETESILNISYCFK